MADKRVKRIISQWEHVIRVGHACPPLVEMRCPDWAETCGGRGKGSVFSLNVTDNH